MTNPCLENILSPAKLNLFLHVTGQRPDGYHLLQSVFVAIDWHDTMHFERRKDGQILRHDLNHTSLPKKDLSIQAAQLLQQISGTSFGVNVSLHKTIPMQAGLGGGSSNAATTLLALNHLWELNLPTNILHTLAQKLGSDVPFFLQGRPAWAEGIGEILTPVTLPENMLKTSLAILKPEQGVATQQIFSSALLTKNTKPAKISDFISSTKDANAAFDFGRNDLQQAAIAAEPQIEQALRWLKNNGVKDARMTGSGSSVFGAIDALNLSNNSPPVGWKLKLCKILDSHPHVQWSSHSMSELDQ